MINALINLTKGRVAPPKQINFQKISKRRGGPSSIQKFMLQILGLYIKLFSAFSEEKKLHNFPNMMGGVKARLEYFRKFIRFGSATRP